MRYVYAVELRHKQYPNDRHSPWVIARSAFEAGRKVWPWVKKQGLPRSQTVIVSINQRGSVEVE